MKDKGNKYSPELGHWRSYRSIRVTGDCMLTHSATIRDFWHKPNPSTEPLGPQKKKKLLPLFLSIFTYTNTKQQNTKGTITVSALRYQGLNEMKEINVKLCCESVLSQC